MAEDIKLFSKKLSIITHDCSDDKNTIDIFKDFFSDVRKTDSQKKLFNLLKKEKPDIVAICLDNDSEKSFELIEDIKDKYKNQIIITLSKRKTFDLLYKATSYYIDGFLVTPIKQNDFINTLKNIEKKYKKDKELEIASQNLGLLKQYQEIADKSSIISKTDTKGKITYANENFCNISGYDKNELLGANHNIVRHPDNPSDLYKTMWEAISVHKKEWSGIIKNKTKSGKTYYVKSFIKPILDKNDTIVEYIALRDNISTIINDKKHLLDQINTNNLSLLILIKIEEFDMLQKFYTIDTIDQIEKTFGYKLLSYLPKNFKFQNVYDLDNGTYALLTDFDEFLNAHINIMDYLEEFANNVKNSKLEIDSMEYNINLTISYSFGKYMLYEDAKSGLDYAIDNNLVVCHSNDFSIQEQKEAQKNLEVIKMVKVALDDYKIVSYFQPIINNKTKEIEKYESLVRLIDDKGNIIAPFQFLQISKKGSYYKKITDRVLENSFSMLDHIQTKLSINLSTRDIEKEETTDKIYELLDKHKSSRGRLIFELLEDENMKNFIVIKSFIKKVKKMGVKIAIDDFGAGYSNFERLLDFEPDILKIDGSLVRNILTDEYNKNLIETIVSFAKKQNIQTVAEYVENENIYNYLCEMGVDYSQGYYFGKPEDLYTTITSDVSN